ncbi:MAG: 16S rRNA (guanine(966)-N(2))-methyltransferase RsmD [Clostridiales bacterium]|nr:16S rRNA (guanine(966)-N(2))-methyltransferase RsmD [Clostridiales bacterium]
MRIITGTARGTKLAAPEGENTRPTADMTKEAVFSMIQFEIEGRRCLDLFAGSGQMGLEALSRGAEKATFVDSSAEAVKIIKQNAVKTHLYQKCLVLNYDFRKYLQAAKDERFDLVFLDPPYDEGGEIDEAVAFMMENGMLENGAYVVCESGRKEPFGHEGLILRKHSRYGKAYISLLYKGDDAT